MLCHNVTALSHIVISVDVMVINVKELPKHRDSERNIDEVFLNFLQYCGLNVFQDLMNTIRVPSDFSFVWQQHQRPIKDNMSQRQHESKSI